MSLYSTLRHLFHPQRSNNHRPKVLHPDALFIFILIVCGFGLLRYPLTHYTRVGNVLGFASNITASDVVSFTNQERAKQGLDPLKANDALNQAALAKAQNMFSKQYWAHVAPDGTEPWKFFVEANYKYSVAGENLARDFSQVSDMMTAWMASPTHRKNILESRYQDIGVAVVDGTLQGTETTLVVQLFGTPQLAQPSIDSGAQKTVAQKGAAAFDQEPAPTPGEITFAEEASPAPAHQAVLASAVMPTSQLQSSIFLSPLQFSKAFFLAIIFMIGSTLIYDSFIMNHRSTVRLVGKNLAHLFLLMVTAFLLVLFRSGMVG